MSCYRRHVRIVIGSTDRIESDGLQGDGPTTPTFLPQGQFLSVRFSFSRSLTSVSSDLLTLIPIVVAYVLLLALSQSRQYFEPWELLEALRLHKWAQKRQLHPWARRGRSRREVGALPIQARPWVKGRPVRMHQPAVGSAGRRRLMV